MQPAARRGRPRDPEVGQAALRVTLDLLEEYGYAGLKVADVAERAGVGLGALYRRWTTKQELVVAALEAAMGEIDIPTSSDPMADLVEGLLATSNGLAGRGGRLLAVLFAGTEPELAEAIRTAKVLPLRQANRERLRRIVGDAPDRELRADLGPGLILMRALSGEPPLTRQQIKQQIVPLMIGSDVGRSRTRLRTDANPRRSGRTRRRDGGD